MKRRYVNSELTPFEADHFAVALTRMNMAEVPCQLVVQMAERIAKAIGRKKVGVGFTVFKIA